MNTEKQKKTYSTILLPSGDYTLVDNVDLWIKDVFPSWRKVKGHVRVVRYLETEYGRAREEYYLHRLIGAPGKQKAHIDHKNGDGLDNRRCNLRWATVSQNCANRKKSEARVKHRGVRCRKDLNLKKPWLAYGTKNRKQIHLGYFQTEKEAALAYNRYARERWGEFAWQNEV